MPKLTGVLRWNVGLVSEALRLPVRETVEYFRDGRIIGDLIERRLATKLDFTPEPVRGGGVVLRDSGNFVWRVRMLTDHVAFAPQSMFGVGRKFRATEFRDFLGTFQGYIVADVHAWPEVPYTSIRTAEVWSLASAGGQMKREPALAALFPKE